MSAEHIAHLNRIVDMLFTERDRLKAANAELAEALRMMLTQTSNIEVLGEWSALDVNLKSGALLRAQVDSVVADCRAALAKNKGETP